MAGLTDKTRHCPPVAVMSQWAVKRVIGVVKVGRGGSWSTKSVEVVEGYNGYRSPTGLVAFYAGCSVFWLTSRQPCIPFHRGERDEGGMPGR